MAELGLFAVALPARYAQLAAPDQAVRAELVVLGLSPDMYAFYQVALDTIFVVVFATIGGLIFLRKPGDPVALLVALMLVTWGPGNDIMVLTPGALLPPEPLTWWHWPFVLIEYVAFMSWMLFSTCSRADGSCRAARAGSRSAGSSLPASGISSALRRWPR